MLKKYTSLPIVIVILVTAMLLLWIILANRPEPAGRESASAGQSSSLTVSQDGSQTSTNVSGLQEGAQSGGGANPQQSLSSQ